MKRERIATISKNKILNIANATTSLGEYRIKLSERGTKNTHYDDTQLMQGQEYDE